MGHETNDHRDSLVELLEFEKSNLVSVRLQQDKERALPSGHPEMFEPDVRTCEEMIRIWSDRIQREHWPDAA